MTWQTLAVVALVELVCIVGIVALAKRPRLFALSSILAIAVVIAGGLAGLDTLSKPKPTRLELERPANAEVLWVGPSGGDMALLLQWSGSKGPRLYTLHLSEEEAAQLREAQTKAKARRQQLRIRDPFGVEGRGPEGEDDGGGEGRAKGPPGSGPGAFGQSTGDNAATEARFYSPPPPPLPEKTQ